MKHNLMYFFFLGTFSVPPYTFPVWEVWDFFKTKILCVSKNGDQDIHVYDHAVKFYMRIHHWNTKLLISFVS